MTIETSSIGPSSHDLTPAGVDHPAAQAQARVSSPVRRGRPNARLALFLGLLSAVVLGISAYLSLPSATLRLVCRHDFRRADITVSIDGEVVHTDTMTGTVKKWLGVLEKTEGTYTRTLPVSSGKHVVKVRLRAPGYDHTRSVEADFGRGQESTLSVDSGRQLSLVWRDTATASPAEPAGASPVWIKYAGSILLTIFGSVVSASIGVLVQDFLRARKARTAEKKEVQR